MEDSSRMTSTRIHRIVIVVFARGIWFFGVMGIVFGISELVELVASTSPAIEAPSNLFGINPEWVPQRPVNDLISIGVRILFVLIVSLF